MANRKMLTQGRVLEGRAGRRAVWHTTRLATATALLAGCVAILQFAAPLGARAGQSSQNKPEDAPHDLERMQHGSHDGGFMQGGMHHTIAKGVTPEAKTDTVAHTIMLREGPITLPAHATHMNVPQPPDVFWTIPLDGWLLAYLPKLVDVNGNAAPGTLLHHTAFWNTNRADFLCPNKDEHIFGAGGEMTSWMQVPGYRVQKGDKIRIETMVHNPTDTAYDKVYLEVRIPYQEASGDAATALTSDYPAWIDAKSCGNSGYDLPAGKSERTGTVAVKYSGVLLGVGGHMHDYDNTTGKVLRDGAMGIVVGYFVPANDSAMANLRRNAKPVVAKTGE